jgi:hypothetical protein
MSFKIITEKKARLLLKDYMAAELAGRDQEAERIEDELNEANWFITVGQDGTTVEKRGGIGEAGDELLLPNENGIQSYRGGATNNGSGNSGIWIGLGITVGGIGLIILIAYLVKTYRANA